MNANAFWDVIGIYNQETCVIQIAFVLAIIFGLIYAYFKHKYWIPKIILSIVNLFIGITFFLIYGTEPIQYYFAAPLFILTGILFIYDAIKKPNISMNPFGVIHYILLALIISYPFISFLLGHSFPKMVVWIMPCPFISFSILIYSLYKQKNILILILLTIWGLTGVKSFFFNAYEDIILLICGFYGIALIIEEINMIKGDNQSEI
ncbi:MAG: hypothetical protein EOL95_07155 [Bacteroidia bacterium]|nr:hypothetical protein [Bacteroidia bacterium]